VAHSSEYYKRLADRYEALAATMGDDKDRETVARLAAQYLRLADAAKRREHALALRPGSPH
jgi:hypothetical protein